MNIYIVAGARSDFVRVTSIIRAVRKAADAGRDTSYQLVCAGKEDDPTLKKSPFEGPQMPYPDTYLGVDYKNLNQLTGLVMIGFKHYLQAQPINVVIVAGNLTSASITAIVTKKQGITLAHLIAGTRSFDINMPEETNRLVINRLSDLLFTAGMGGNDTATCEGAELSKICVVGNILADTLRFNHNRLQRPAVPDKLGVRENDYIIFTLNRKALLADKVNLKDMLHAMLDKAGDRMVLAPLRSRSAAVVAELLGTNHPTFKLIKLLSYLQFDHLTARTCGVIADSGNVTEEATFNNIPCITLDSYTKHIETVKVGSNVLVGEDAHLLSRAVEDMVNGAWKKRAIPNRWDERNARRIVQILLGQP